MKIKYILKKKRAGKKTEEKEKSESSYVIHNISTCPLNSYIEAVCNNDYKSLIVSGNPPEEDLRIALIEISSEFSSLCGSPAGSSVNNSIRKIYLYRNAIIQLNICVNLIFLENYSCAEVLKKHGIKLIIPTDKEVGSLLNRIKSLIKTKTVQLKEEMKRLEDKTKDQDDKKVTVQDFNDQIAAVSKSTGFHINKASITLAEYASYVKLHNNSLKNIPHGINK